MPFLGLTFWFWFNFFPEKTDPCKDDKESQEDDIVLTSEKLETEPKESENTSKETSKQRDSSTNKVDKTVVDGAVGGEAPKKEEKLKSKKNEPSKKDDFGKIPLNFISLFISRLKPSWKFSHHLSVHITVSDIF